MSKSRLEKFLYALYSLDSSDLPNPLSRIEELYKCLVTGEEVPSFKPTSRVEKYLMAILGGYDIDSLPNPISRVEVLLYKLATGDDSLEGFDTFLSEHEELLAEIIRNGGVGGNIDIEYVLYTLSTEFNTLYNTAEKPVKSAILKGNTLVNIVKKQEKPFSHSVGSPMQNNNLSLNTSLKANTLYTRFIHVSTLDLGTTYQVGMYDALMGHDGSYNQYSYTINSTGWLINTFTTKTTSVSPYMINPDTNALSNGLINMEIDRFMIIEGDYTNVDIPYFEGMQSVKMPVLTTVGKNICNLFNYYLKIGWGDVKASIKTVTNQSLTFRTNTTNDWIGVGYELEPNKKYSVTMKVTCNSSNAPESYRIYRSSTSYTKVPIGEEFNRIFDGSNEKLTICGIGLDNYFTIEYLSIIESDIIVPYKPYKSNILTTSEEVELRCVGEVKDELNLLTGELTQRIGEIVLDGSEEEWILSTTKNNTQVFNLPATNSKIKKVKRNGLIMCDKLKVVSGVDEEIINLTSSIYIGLLKSKASTVEELKVYLSQNPITFIHEFVKGSIKTVDLSVVNQDGNNTELSTFNDITHVTLSSEALIPEAELEVATKNEEVLDTMSLRMDDISAAQTTIEETSDAQSENVDATMFATTEIYEELL